MFSIYLQCYPLGSLTILCDVVHKIIKTNKIYENPWKDLHHKAYRKHKALHGISTATYTHSARSEKIDLLPAIFRTCFGSRFLFAVFDATFFEYYGSSLSHCCFVYLFSIHHHLCCSRCSVFFFCTAARIRGTRRISLLNGTYLVSSVKYTVLSKWNPKSRKINWKIWNSVFDERNHIPNEN